MVKDKAASGFTIVTFGIVKKLTDTDAQLVSNTVPPV
jgi:hypothetical protein